MFNFSYKWSGLSVPLEGYVKLQCTYYRPNVTPKRSFPAHCLAMLHSYTTQSTSMMSFWIRRYRGHVGGEMRNLELQGIKTGSVEGVDFSWY